MIRKDIYLCSRFGRENG